MELSVGFERDNAAILELLRMCRFDPEAVSTYDVFAGGLIWADEIPDLPRLVWFRVSLHLRDVIAYRASLSLGEPRIELENEWNQLKREVPDWPGFREDRILGRARRLLMVHKYEEAECFRELEEICQDADSQIILGES
mgnify:CR=1 FL=1